MADANAGDGRASALRESQSRRDRDGGPRPDGAVPLLRQGKGPTSIPSIVSAHGPRGWSASPVADPASWQLIKSVEHLLWGAMQEDDYITESFGEYLHHLLRTKGVRQKELCARIHMSQGYLSSIIKDERRPSRDVLIQIAFGLCLDVAETSELLERGGACRLREDVRRDSVIAVCLRFGIQKAYCDNVLFEIGEKKIGDAGAQ